MHPLIPILLNDIKILVQLNGAGQKAGVIVPLGDTDGMVSVLKDLAHDRKKKGIMAVDVRRYAHTHFNKEVILSQFEKVLLDQN